MRLLHVSLFSHREPKDAGGESLLSRFMANESTARRAEASGPKVERRLLASRGRLYWFLCPSLVGRSFLNEAGGYHPGPCQPRLGTTSQIEDKTNFPQSNSPASCDRHPLVSHHLAPLLQASVCLSGWLLSAPAFPRRLCRSSFLPESQTTATHFIFIFPKGSPTRLLTIPYSSVP